MSLQLCQSQITPMPARAGIAVVFVCFTLFHLHAVAAPATACKPNDLSGSWQRIHASEDDIARKDAIETVTTEMNFIIRGIARTIINRSTNPDEWMEISLDGREIQVRTPDGMSLIPLRDNIRVSDDDGACAIAEHWARDESHGSTMWILNQDRSELTLRYVVHDPNLGNALTYANRYQRRDPAQ